MNRRIRVLIADDERPARDRLIALLRRESSTELVGECKNGDEVHRTLADAAASLRRIDLVFLDIHLPGVNGLDLLETLVDESAGPLPVFVFVTADERYAVRALRIGVADYVLKPFTDERFDVALRRAMAAIPVSRMTSP